jgi:protein ImuB
MDLRRRRLQQAGTWQPDRPFVIVALEGQQRNLIAVNAAAAARGIAPGMALSRARVIAPEVNARPARPLADARALDRLAVQMLRYSPLVAACPPDGLWIDATGAAHLFGGEAAMVARIQRRLQGMGFAVRAAIAATPGAAWAWAREHHAGDAVLDPGAEQHALNALPLRALRLSSETLHALRHVGLKTVADLRALPRKTVPVRFGADVLQRLDQALGRAPEAITPILPPAARRRRMAFAEPIATPEALRHCIGILTAQLCCDLDKSGEGARHLDLIFARVDNRIESIRLRTAHPSRDAAHLAKLLTEKLGDVDPGFGIEAATLTAWRVGPLQAVQLETAGGTAAAGRDLGILVDCLASRVGARHVFKFAAVPSDIPERAAVPSNPMNTADAAWPAHLPRPLRLLSPPEPIQVIALMPDYPPAKFRWRERLHTVRIADGPERIFGEWWRAPREVGDVRDYFRVENEDGERYWLFRAGRPAPGGGQEYRWYVHGAFA